MRVIRKQCEHGGRSDEEEAVSNGSGKELSEVLDDCNIQKKGGMKLMMHTGKYMTKLLMSQLALTTNTVITTGMKYMKRSTVIWEIFVVKIFS